MLFNNEGNNEDNKWLILDVNPKTRFLSCKIYKTNKKKIKKKKKTKIELPSDLGFNQLIEFIT